MLRVSLACCLFAALAFAGCADDSPRDLSAHDGHPRADAKVQGWQSDAVLVAIGAVETDDAEALRRAMNTEGSDLSDVQAFTDTMAARADLRLGDGKAPAWIYMYIHPQGLAIVAVAADRTTLHTFDMPMQGMAPAWSARLGAAAQPGPGAPLDWEIDSTQAAQTVMEGSETFAALAAAGRGNITWSLDASGVSDDGPVWRIVYGAGEEHFLASVHAVTGALIDDVPLEAPSAVQTVSDTFDGRLDPVTTPQAYYVFQVGVGHPVLHLQVEPTLVGAGEGTVHLIGPGGELGAHTIAGPPGLQEASFEVIAPAAGNYTVEVTLDSGALLGYRGTWCAAGQGPLAAPC